jgi:hypothetical protein
MSIRRICTQCHTQAEGLWPDGWTITPLYDTRGTTGERAYCPACQHCGVPRPAYRAPGRPQYQAGGAHPTGAYRHPPARP